MARAKKVEEVVVEATEEVVPTVAVEETPKKTRCDFNSWKEYNDYKGAKA